MITLITTPKIATINRETTVNVNTIHVHNLVTHLNIVTVPSTTVNLTETDTMMINTPIIAAVTLPARNTPVTTTTNLPLAIPLVLITVTSQENTPLVITAMVVLLLLDAVTALTQPTPTTTMATAPPGQSLPLHLILDNPISLLLLLTKERQPTLHPWIKRKTD